MNNKVGKKATALGAVLFILAILYFALPYFLKDLWEINFLVLTSGFTLSILLIIAPDKAINFLLKKLGLNNKENEEKL